MDTISRENNPSILPMVGAILGGLGCVLAIVAIVKASPVKKLSTDVESLTNQVQSVSGDISAAKDAAGRATSSVNNLATQTQRGFDAVTAELGNLRTDVNKLATAKTAAPKAKDGAVAKDGEKAGPGGDYAIKAGDTLNKVAKAHGVSLSALEAANPGVDSSHLKIGQKINLPK